MRGRYLDLPDHAIGSIGSQCSSETKHGRACDLAAIGPHVMVGFMLLVLFTKGPRILLRGVFV